MADINENAKSVDINKQDVNSMADGLRQIIENHMQEHAVDFKAGHSELLIEQLEALITKREGEARIDELNSLSHEPNMYGDWEQVINDRIATLKGDE